MCQSNGPSRWNVSLTYPWLEIEEDCSRDVTSVVGLAEPARNSSVSCTVRTRRIGVPQRRRGVYLVEEDVLPIPSLGGEVFEVAVLADSMFLTEMLPELTSDLETRRERDDVPRARGRVRFSHDPGGSTIPLLPHWPAWIVMISLALAA